MRAGLRVNEMRVDAHSIPIALRGAFEDAADGEFFSDRLGVVPWHWKRNTETSGSPPAGAC